MKKDQGEDNSGGSILGNKVKNLALMTFLIGITMTTMKLDFNMKTAVGKLNKIYTIKRYVMDAIIIIVSISFV